MEDNIVHWEIPENIYNGLLELLEDEPEEEPILLSRSITGSRSYCIKDPESRLYTCYKIINGNPVRVSGPHRDVPPGFKKKKFPED